MRLQLVTLDGIKADEEIYSVTIPTEGGEITVFPSHEALVTMATLGVLQVRHHKGDSDDQKTFFAIYGGVVKINQESVIILVDEAESDDEIVEADAKEALRRAEELKNGATSRIELENAHKLLQRSHLKLKVSELKRRKRR